MTIYFLGERGCNLLPVESSLISTDQFFERIFKFSSSRQHFSSWRLRTHCLGREDIFKLWGILWVQVSYIYIHRINLRTQLFLRAWHRICGVCQKYYDENRCFSLSAPVVTFLINPAKWQTFQKSCSMSIFPFLSLLLTSTSRLRDTGTWNGVCYKRGQLMLY